MCVCVCVCVYRPACGHALGIRVRSLVHGGIKDTNTSATSRALHCTRHSGVCAAAWCRGGDPQVCTCACTRTTRTRTHTEDIDGRRQAIPHVRSSSSPKSNIKYAGSWGCMGASPGAWGHSTGDASAVAVLSGTRPTANGWLQCTAPNAGVRGNTTRELGAVDRGEWMEGSKQLHRWCLTPFWLLIIIAYDL